MLGKKQTPPNLGMEFLCILRALGVSYNFLRLQKLIICGIVMMPHIALRQKAMMIYMDC